MERKRGRRKNTDTLRLQEPPNDDEAIDNGATSDIEEALDDDAVGLGDPIDDDNGAGGSQNSGAQVDGSVHLNAGGSDAQRNPYSFDPETPPQYTARPIQSNGVDAAVPPLEPAGSDSPRRRSESPAEIPVPNQTPMTYSLPINNEDPDTWLPEDDWFETDWPMDVPGSAPLEPSVQCGNQSLDSRAHEQQLAATKANLAGGTTIGAGSEMAPAAAYTMRQPYQHPAKQLLDPDLAIVLANGLRKLMIRTTEVNDICSNMTATRGYIAVR